jgi:GT2 family glycosyltransferase
VRLAWAATPRRVRDAVGSFVHPIAAGPRAGRLSIHVPEGLPARRFDVLLEHGAREHRPAFVRQLSTAGHRIFDVGTARLDEFARRERILDAVYVVDGAAPPERLVQARRFGWRVSDGADDLADVFPSVSVVVVTHSNKSLCRSCLAALSRNSAWPTLEIVVVDNGSIDDTREMLEAAAAEDGRVKVIFNRENQGFATAANQGMKASNGEFIVLLNDDAAVGPGWLSRLVSRFESSERFGLVCPATNEANTLARVPVDYTSFSEMEAFAEHRAFDYAGAWRETEFVSLFCALSRRSILESVGLLDERFAVGMFEDDDLAYSLRKRGLDLGIALDAFVHHVGQASFSRLDDSEYLALWESNRRRFEDKWGVRWHPPRQGDG